MAIVDGVTGELTVSATVTDNVEVAVVRVYLNINAPVAAIGSDTWSVTLTDVSLGTNTVFVEAIDTIGNRGQAARSFFYSVCEPLALAIVGQGTVTGLGA